jgi:hypothetical protein
MTFAQLGNQWAKRMDYPVAAYGASLSAQLSQGGASTDWWSSG